MKDIQTRRILMERAFNPRSVALVGASPVKKKWGNFLARHLLLGEDKREVILVNRSGETIEGHSSCKSLSELEIVPDLVVLTIPAATSPALIDEALDHGCRAFVIMAAGYSEFSEEGKLLEQRITQAIAERDGILFGPNCVGIQDTAARLFASRIVYPAGKIGVASQSGMVTNYIGRLLASQGMGMSRAANVGNQAIIDIADAVRSFEGHEGTQALIAYVEDPRDGRELLDAFASVRDSGIPVVAITIGSSEASARSAMSHTGALVSSADVVEAALRSNNVLQAATPREAVAIVNALTNSAFRPRGPRTAILTDGGGMGSLAAENMPKKGISVPLLSPSLQEGLKGATAQRVSVGNPVDLAGEQDYDLSTFERAAATVLASDEIDALFITGFLGAYGGEGVDAGTEEARVVEAIIAASREYRKPIYVHSLDSVQPNSRLLHDNGIAVFATQEDAIDGIAGAVRLGAFGERQMEPLVEPDPAIAVDDSYFGARALLSGCGVQLVPARQVGSVEGALGFAAEVGYPVVLKAVGLLHKSDEGGVLLGIDDDDKLAQGFAEFRAKFPNSPISIEKQIDLSKGLELLIGARVDSSFGPTITVGIGGIYAEIFKMVGTAIAPLTQSVALDLLNAQQFAPLLSGARGRPALDKDAVARVLANMSRLACDLRDRIDAFEINPLIVLPDAAYALDARIIPAEQHENAHN